MIRTVIIEDEERNINALKGIIEVQCPQLQISGTAGSITESLSLLARIKPDLVLMDVELTDGLSFEILNQMEKWDFDIIFITAFNLYAVNAFRFAAIDYLLKPVNPFELKEAVERAEEKKLYCNMQLQIDFLLNNLSSSKSKIQRIALPTMEDILFVNIEDIITIEAAGSYSVFQLVGDKKITVSKLLREYDDLFKGDPFIRVHNSSLVNIAHVKQYVKGRGGHVVMNDDRKIEVSARRKDAFLKRMGH